LNGFFWHAADTVLLFRTWGTLFSLPELAEMPRTRCWFDQCWLLFGDGLPVARRRVSGAVSGRPLEKSSPEMSKDNYWFIHSPGLLYFFSWRLVTKNFMSFLNDIHFGSSWTNNFRINITIRVLSKFNLQMQKFFPQLMVAPIVDSYESDDKG
jgi:hypothetical protein